MILFLIGIILYRYQRRYLSLSPLQFPKVWDGVEFGKTESRVKPK